ncbi:hypothetical protein ARSEF4850_002640 [Beauveria asiatica]
MRPSLFGGHVLESTSGRRLLPDKSITVRLLQNLKCLYFSLAARHRQSQPPQRPHSRSPGSSTATAAEQEDAPQRSPNPLHKGLYKMEMGGGDRDLDDTSILRAREHVMGAEAAEEEEADQALDAAREHVWRLEEEAEADARRARIKQHHAAEVSKRGKMLGLFILQISSPLLTPSSGIDAPFNQFPVLRSLPSLQTLINPSDPALLCWTSGP